MCRNLNKVWVFCSAWMHDACQHAENTERKKTSTEIKCWHTDRCLWFTCKPLWPCIRVQERTAHNAHATAQQSKAGVTAHSSKFTLIGLLIFLSLRQDIWSIYYIINLFIYSFSQSVSQSCLCMAEKLSVISLSYQMVEGLINNFKSNNWRAGQIHRHTVLMTHNTSCLCKSPAHAQMHIIHTAY